MVCLDALKFIYNDYNLIIYSDAATHNVRIEVWDKDEDKEDDFL
jgi:hypothetical protein